MQRVDDTSQHDGDIRKTKSLQFDPKCEMSAGDWRNDTTSHFFWRYESLIQP